jgi:hypothetical protein
MVRRRHTRWSETYRTPTPLEERNQSSMAFITVYSYHSHRRIYEHRNQND